MLEYAHTNLGAYNACIDLPLDIRDGHIILSDRPGLGHELNLTTYASIQTCLPRGTVFLHPNENREADTPAYPSGARLN